VKGQRPFGDLADKAAAKAEVGASGGRYLGQYERWARCFPA
jgi:hypothetical protein